MRLLWGGALLVPAGWCLTWPSRPAHCLAFDKACCAAAWPLDKASSSALSAPPPPRHCYKCKQKSLFSLPLLPAPGHLVTEALELVLDHRVDCQPANEGGDKVADASHDYDYGRW